jgi:hypothetical protein
MLICSKMTIQYKIEGPKVSELPSSQFMSSHLSFAFGVQGLKVSDNFLSLVVVFKGLKVSDN